MSLFSFDLRIETERTIIRRFAMDDLYATHEWCSDPRVPMFMSWKAHQTLNDTLRFLEYCIEQYQKNEIAPWALEFKKDKKVIGSCNFSEQNGHRAEIAYCLNPKYWGQGIASEAVKGLVAYGFENGLYRIQATCEPENKASLAVLKKNGFETEGILKMYGTHGDGELYVDVVMCAKLRNS